MQKYIGLQRGEAFLTHFRPHRLHPVQIGDLRRVIFRMIDAPGAAMRPVNANAVAHLAAQQLIAGHPHALRLGIKHRIFDRPQAFRDHAAGRRAGQRVHQREKPFMVVRRLTNDLRAHRLDHLRHAGRAEPFVKFAPANNPAFRCHLDEVIVPPARIAMPRFNFCDFHAASSPDKFIQYGHFHRSHPPCR